MSPLINNLKVLHISSAFYFGFDTERTEGLFTFHTSPRATDNTVFLALRFELDSATFYTSRTVAE
jgi:hypothetical protein